jgi:hypothetical protein
MPHFRCRLGDYQHSGAADLVVLEVLQGPVRLGQRVAGGVGADGDLGRLFQELAAVLARVAGHRSDVALVEHVAGRVARPERSDGRGR